MKKVLLVVVSMLLGAVITGAALFQYLGFYKIAYDCKNWPATCDQVCIESVANDLVRRVDLDDSQSLAFIDAWIQASHSSIHAGMCHQPAFAITFSNGEESLTVRSFCAKCHNYKIRSWFLHSYQGINLRSDHGATILAILEEHFPELFQAEDEES